MKIGALVKWSKEWIDGYDGSVYTPQRYKTLQVKLGLLRNNHPPLICVGLSFGVVAT